MAIVFINGNVTLPSWAATTDIYTIQAGNFTGPTSTDGAFTLFIEDTAGDFYLFFDLRDAQGNAIGQPVSHGPYDPTA